MKVPRRMIFFDSEAQVSVDITDEEVERASDPAELEQVIKEHNPYLICASFRGEHERRPGEYRVRKRVYHARTIPGVGTFNEGHDNFIASFWNDVNAFALPAVHTYIFAHNAKYDTLVTSAVYHLVQQHGYTLEEFSDDNPFIMRLEKVVRVERRYDKKKDREYDHPIIKTIFILSSTNYYQQSLKSLGKAFSLPKMDFAHGAPFSLPEAITYCLRDVEILEKAMLAFILFVRKEGLGNFAKTVAGQAFQAFKHRFLGGKIVWIHSDTEALAVERRAYAGGRTECFHIGRVPEELFYVDVNSMYPYVMKHFLYPTKLVTRWGMCTVNQLRQAIADDYLVCADVRVSTERPVFHQKKERLIFPVGDYWTTLSTPELIYALDRGLILEVGPTCLYESDNLFEGFVDYFYEARLAAKKVGDKVHDLLYKIIMNSLYGKFGQLTPPWEEIGKADPTIAKQEVLWVADEKRRETFRTYGGKIYRKNPDLKTEESQDSFPAVASHVTGYARMLLLSYIECAGWENVFYTDTDSLFTNRKGYEALKEAGHLDNKQLGKLKLEDTGYGHFNGCKDYIFLGRAGKISIKQPVREARRPKPRSVRRPCFKLVKIKGISKSARQLPDTPDGKLRFAVNQWTGYAENLRNRGQRRYYTKIIIKVLAREYNKGTVTSSGRVEPYRFDYARESREAYEAMLKEGVNDLFVLDPIKHFVKALGRIQRPLPGERFYGEYAGLPKTVKVRFFILHGKPMDEWADEAGMGVRELLDKLEQYPLNKAM